MTTDTAVAWLREQVQARLEAAKAAIRKGSGEWRTGCRCEGECRDYPDCCRIEGDDLTIYDEGGHNRWQAQHIALNDPQDVIAQCEAELAILDEHAPDEDGHCSACVTTRDRWQEDWPLDKSPCGTVRFVASGYRHWAGYGEHWPA